MIVFGWAAKFERAPLSEGSVDYFILLGLAAAVLLTAWLLKGHRGKRRRWGFRPYLKTRRSWPSRFRRDVAALPTPDIANPKEQLEAISFVDFETQPLLNREEVPILRLLEREAYGLNAGFRVMAQTSMGEILRPKVSGSTPVQRELAFRAINSKRLDFAIFNRFGKLVLAVEYQGSGHFHRTSFMRDAVKREALRKANVEFLAIYADYAALEISTKVRRALTEYLRKIDRQTGPDSDDQNDP